MCLEDECVVENSAFNITCRLFWWRSFLVVGCFNRVVVVVFVVGGVVRLIPTVVVNDSHVLIFVVIVDISVDHDCSIIVAECVFRRKSLFLDTRCCVLDVDAAFGINIAQEISS